MKTSNPRLGFTLLELLAVIGIIGVLVALMLPAVQGVREAARRTDCSNRIRQLALATQLHHDALGYFPPARFQPRPGDPINLQGGGESPTWLALVMPYIEQVSLSEQWDFKKKWHEHDERTRNTVPDIFLCPSRRSGTNPIGVIDLAYTRTIEVTSESHGPPRQLPCGCWIPGPVIVSTSEQEETAYQEVTGALSDYAGNHGDLQPGAVGEATDFYFGGNGTGVIISVRANTKEGVPVSPYDRIRMASVTDGQSSTFLFGEKHVSYGKLATYPYDSPAYDGDHLPASCRLAGPGLRISNGPNDLLADMFSFGSWHPGGTHFALVDGSVRFLSSDTDTKLLGSLANRQDARVVELVQ
jgi:prepilin-type N-terminal cleavage/methylation domain-containing protein/prepilin-type processing-associated H-X9-DG protein